MSGLFVRANLPFGFNFIASIPPRAENVSFYHAKPTSNYLGKQHQTNFFIDEILLFDNLFQALRDQSGTYILNGPFGMNYSGSFFASGTTFSYKRPSAQGGDQIFSRGPTTETLDVMVSSGSKTRSSTNSRSFEIQGGIRISFHRSYLTHFSPELFPKLADLCCLSS